MTTDSYHLGIDLGTTYVAAGILRQGRPEIVTLGDRAPVVPSVLFFKEDGEVLHGESATRRGLSDPTRVVREFKRRVGDATPMVVGQTPYSADVLLAKLLRFTHRAVVERQGSRPASIAVTHPANWGSYKIDVLHQAVQMAEIGEITTLTEPVAAAIHYAATERLDAGQTIAVYDLGGGTFDAAVLARTASGVGFEVRGDVEGIERLGGIDFDEAVFHHALRWCESAVAELDPDDPATLQALARLRQECIEAKEALSTDTDVSIPVVLPNIQTEVRLTRAEFEAMIRPLLQQTVEALQRAIRNSGVAVDDLAAVLLVGGSSRVPLIAEMVGAELGRPIAVDQHPKHTVALGAAIAAGREAGAALPNPAPSSQPAPSNQAGQAAPSSQAAGATTGPSPEGATPNESQLVPIRREGDGPQGVITRTEGAAANAAPPATPVSPPAPAAAPPSVPVVPAVSVPAVQAVGSGVGAAAAPGGVSNGVASGPGQAARPPASTAGHRADHGLQAPGQPPTGSTRPFDHRDLLAEAPTRSGPRRVGPLLAVAGIVIVAIVGAVALLLNQGDEADTTTADQAAVDTNTDAADTADDTDDAAGGDDATPTTAETTDDATGSTDDAGVTTSTTAASTTSTTAETTTTAASGLSATIGAITIDGDRYAVDYTTTFEPVISGDPSTHHLHFFFDTVGVDNAGAPGAGPWALYDGPSPFRGYGPGDRPAGATQLCVTVATSDHAVDDASVFHCADLP